MSTQLIDIYHGNEVSSFHAIAAAGIVGCILKATQSTMEIDLAFSSYLPRAKAAELLVGAYHFFDPDADPVLQADHFHNNAPMGSGTLGWWLDVETLSKVSSPESIGPKVAIASDRLKVLTGFYPGIYASDSFYETYLRADFPIGYHKLWIARYGAKPVTPYTLWQYSESGTVCGVSGAVDLDVFDGDLDTFKTDLVLP